MNVDSTSPKLRQDRSTLLDRADIFVLGLMCYFLQKQVEHVRILFLMQSFFERLTILGARGVALEM